MKIDIQFIYGLILGWFLHSLFFNKKFRDAIIFFITFRWVIIQLPKDGVKFGKVSYHHDPKKPPKEFPRRLWPPRHPGGRPSEDIDSQALAMMQEGKSLDEIIQEIYANEFPDEVIADPYFYRQEKERIKRRLKRKAKNTKTLSR